MSHLCEAAVLTCEDFRLHQRRGGGNFIGEFVAGLNVDCDIITRAGCVQDLVRPQAGSDASLLRDLVVSVDLHKVKTIYFVAHENCGAYGHFGFENRMLELDQHRADLLAAREVVAARFPGVEIQLRIAELEPGTTDKWRLVIVH
ncbi:MAG: hypothetical protein P9L99_01970 [Candidatus Lernaella stagnicola]|nr:hypothetical protein [Candidatus Lernaella stagnicola]